MLAVFDVVFVYLLVGVAVSFSRAIVRRESRPVGDVRLAGETGIEAIGRTLAVGVVWLPWVVYVLARGVGLWLLGREWSWLWETPPSDLGE